MIKFPAVLMFISVCTGFGSAVASESAMPSFREWGDQGDGTFKNPILNADYPDSDVERQGDTFYMISSTFHTMPANTILSSKDLVNWTLVGHMWDSLDYSPEYNWDQMAGYGAGVWAGDLACHDDRWYCYFIDWEHGFFVSTSKAVTGPWTTPHKMRSSTRWDDPSVYWDEDEKQAYLIASVHNPDDRKKETQETELRLFRMSWDGMELEDEGTPIYYGHGAEASKIYRKDGYFYIFIAQWIDGDRKQVVLRSTSLSGPFEKKNILNKPKGWPRSTSQGALIEMPDGSWWLTHQLIQERLPEGTFSERNTPSFEGRPQWLVPVTWVDGWPVAGKDGETVLQHKKPLQGEPVAVPETNTEFASTRLGPQWQWNHNPRNTHWSLSERPGWLRLKAGKPVGNGGFWCAANTLSQRLMGTGTGQATTKMDLSGMVEGQQAGFCHHSIQYILCGIKVINGEKRIVFNLDGKETLGTTIDTETIWFRTDIDGAYADFSYSLNGKEWTSIGKKFLLKFGHWRGDRIGFYCWNDLKAGGHVDIDCFHYDFEGPHEKSTGTARNRPMPKTHGN